MRTSRLSEGQIVWILEHADATGPRATQAGAGRDAQNNIRLRMNFQIGIWGYWRNSHHRCLASRLHIVR